MAIVKLANLSGGRRLRVERRNTAGDGDGILLSLGNSGTEGTSRSIKGSSLSVTVALGLTVIVCFCM